MKSGVHEKAMEYEWKVTLMNIEPDSGSTFTIFNYTNIKLIVLREDKRKKKDKKKIKQIRWH